MKVGYEYEIKTPDEILLLDIKERVDWVLNNLKYADSKKEVLKMDLESLQKLNNNALSDYEVLVNNLIAKINYILPDKE